MTTITQQKHTNQSLDSSLTCSTTRCIEDETKDKLQCADCKNYYHYRCTQLPPYQIQAFIEKRIKRHYYCQNCITVPAEIERQPNNKRATGNQKIKKRYQAVRKFDKSERGKR